jgi:hypothetical protein
MKPASRLELSRGPLAAPLEGIIVGSSNIGDTKEHAARCGFASTAGVHNSFHDALRQGPRVVDTYRHQTGLDTHAHAPVLRLQHKRGAAVLDSIHPRWQPLGTSPTTQSRQEPSRIIAELRRLADDDEEEQGVLPMLAHVQKRAERVVAESICVPGPCRLGGHLLCVIG